MPINYSNVSSIFLDLQQNALAEHHVAFPPFYMTAISASRCPSQYWLLPVPSSSKEHILETPTNGLTKFTRSRVRLSSKFSVFHSKRRRSSLSAVNVITNNVIFMDVTPCIMAVQYQGCRLHLRCRFKNFSSAVSCRTQNS